MAPFLAIPTMTSLGTHASKTTRATQALMVLTRKVWTWAFMGSLPCRCHENRKPEELAQKLVEE